MLKVIISLLFFVSLSVASKLIKYNFKHDLEDLKNRLETGEDIRSVLDSFNSDSRQFGKEIITPSVEALKEYVSIKEEAICLLFRNPSTDFKLRELEVFNKFLIEDITRYEFYFSQESLHYILAFLLKTATEANIKTVKHISTRIMQKLTPEQVIEFVNLNVFDTEESYVDVEEKINEISSLSDPEQICSLICQVSVDNIKISAKSYEILGEHLRFLDFEAHPDWLIPVLDALSDFFLKGVEFEKFTKYVCDLIFSEKVVSIISTLEVNDSYSLLLYFTTKDSEFFKEKLQLLTVEIQTALAPYANVLSTAAKIYRYILIISKLNAESNEGAFRLAISAINNLIKLKKENSFARKFIITEYKNIFELSLNLNAIYTVEIHPLNTLAWRVVGMIGYLCHDLSKEDKTFVTNCFANIISGFGHVLLKQDLEFPDGFIEEFLPKIDMALDRTLNNIKKLKTSLRYQDLQAVIKFIQLHPSEKEGNFYIDRFCAQFISDVPPQFNKYTTIKDLKITDEKSIHVSGFLTFLDNYVRNPNDSKLLYLREFYLFLKDSKYLSKSELLCLELNFNGFRKRVKK